MNESQAEAIRNQLLDQPYNSDVPYLSDKEAVRIASRLHVHLSHEYTEWSRSTRPEYSLDPGMEATIGNLANYLIDKTLQLDKSTPTATDFDPVSKPEHYNSDPSGVECIQITRHRNFNIGNAIKYLWRAGLKDETAHVQDLQKAIWYINDEIDRLQDEHRSRV